MIPPAVSADPGTSRVTVAAFDFDGTLTRGGSVIPFLLAVRGPWPVAVALAINAWRLARAALVGGPTADDAKERVFVKALGGLSADDVDSIAARFAERHLARRIRPEVQARLDWHREQGHHVVIVSASPECYVRPAGLALRADGVLATRLAVDSGGTLTGRYDGKNCRGSEKYARVVAWLRANGLSRAGSAQPTLWAYGNSRGDLRLLDAADHGVDAGQLGRLGRLHRFPTLQALDMRPGP